MNISKYFLVVLSFSLVLPNVVCAMDQEQAEEKQQAEQKVEQAHQEANAQVEQKRKKSKKEKKELSLKSVSANILACSIGALAGYALKKLWEDKTDVSFWIKFWFSIPLLGCPHKFANEIDASKELTSIALISSAVFAQAFNK